MRILYVAMKHDYGDPRRGLSFEHCNFFESLQGMGYEIVYFDFISLLQKMGRDAMNRRLAEVARSEKPDVMFTVLFEDELDPTDGKLTYLRDARRRALWIEPDAHTPATDGKDIQLSIDVVIQQIAQQKLTEVVKAYNAGGARAIVLNCQTGEILAFFFGV